MSPARNINIPSLASILPFLTPSTTLVKSPPVDKNPFLAASVLINPPDTSLTAEANAGDSAVTLSISLSSSEAAFTPASP